MKRLLSAGALAALASCGIWISTTNGRAQSISFGKPTKAESCAENASTLAGFSGHALMMKIRTSIPGWRTFNGTDEQLQTAFLNANPCMKLQIARSRCPEVQALVDDTAVGDTLGARLKIIFPSETNDMRDRYAEMFVKSFCPSVKGPSAARPTAAMEKAGPISFFVDVPVDVDGFVSPALVGIRENAREISSALLKARGKPDRLVQARNKDVADVLVTVVARELAGADRHVVHVRIGVQGKIFDIEGADEDWDGAAAAAGTQTADWINENRDRIVRGRQER